MHTCNISVCLAIAGVSLHLIAIFVSCIYGHYFVTVCIRYQMFELCVYVLGVCRCTTVAMHMNEYVQCSNHIYSVIYVKYVYSAHCHMGDCIDFICGMYMHIHLPYKFMKYLTYMAYMSSLVGLFVPSTYLAVTWEVYIADGCILAHMCKNVGSIYPFSILVI